MIKGESSNSPSDWPRSIVAAPESFNGRNLSEAELAFWATLDKQFAPFVVGDESSDQEEMPTPLSVAWCSLYPLAIYFMTASVKQAFAAADVIRPQGPDWIQWNALLTEFWKRREEQLTAFRTFLADWGLSKILSIPENDIKHDAQASHKTPYEDDKKVLGLHRFQAWGDVADYTLRWGRNPLIRDTHLWQHRLTVSRGIDLICSELLANGFEHGGPNGADVFIMAKLCSHNSAWRALELNKRMPYLTPTEQHFFKRADEHKCPILQLCIGDTGQGFGGNAALRKEYLNAIGPNGSDLDESKLITFALSGKISTKTREHHRSYWRGQMEGEVDLTPTNHGLAEVRRFVRKMHGYWRIHSNAVAVDQDFLAEQINKNEFPPPVTSEVRSVPGCLHYFMFPLLSEEKLPTLRPVRRPSGAKRFRLIDAADDRLTKDPLRTRIDRPEEWVGPFCDRIVKAQNEHAGAVLVHLAAFDHLIDKDLEDACLDLGKR